MAAIYSGHLTPEAKELLGGLGLLANLQSNLLQVKLKEEKSEEQDGDCQDFKDMDSFPEDIDLEYDGHDTFSDEQDSDYSEYEEKPAKRRKKKQGSKQRNHSCLQYI